MKKITGFILSSFLLTSCIEPTDEPVMTEYKPILIDRSDLEKSIAMENPRTIKNAGKIYRKDHLLFINEKYEGIHVYDNTDPTNPKAIAFLKIPGNVDIAIKNDVIYADNSVDLVALRYWNEQLVELDRNRNVFPEISPPDFGEIPDAYLKKNRPENTVIIKWVRK